jgi:hypothetical protein
MVDIYNDAMEESLSISIHNIINQNNIYNFENIINNIMEDEILFDNTKNLLIEYYNNDNIYTLQELEILEGPRAPIQVTFRDLLCNTWLLINNLDTRNEIKSILNNEINEHTCRLLRNRIFRLINCLNGFTNLVNINNSHNKQIGNIIIIIKEKLELENNYSIEKHKELIEKELNERGFMREIINDWVNYIE